MKESSNKYPSVWVLADDKPGHENQAVGVAESLGFQFSIKKIFYNKKGGLPNFVKGSSLLGIDTKKSDTLKEPWPDIVIAAGRKTAPAAKYIKKKSGGKTFICQIMWPGFPATGFDLIAAPAHDKKKESKNVITTLGAPHRVTKGVLKREGDMWKKTLGELKAPCIALLVGGSAGDKIFTEEHAESLGAFVYNMIKNLGGSLLVTTSRRTSDDVTSVLRKKLQNHSDFPVFFHDPKKERANPYYAFLKLSNAIIATGDSVSMCSEACSTGKPVYIYAPDEITPKKHRSMHQSLYKSGHAVPLMQKEMSVFMPGQITPLNTSADIAKKIKEMIGL